MTSYKLVIADKRISSWSLRPWLLLRQAGIPFTEINVSLHRPDSRKQILVHSPSGRVPALLTGQTTIWDSLAISEYLAETYPEKKLWPTDAVARALARSVSAEMHAGFQALRTEMSMDCLSTIHLREISAECRQDVDRIQAIWRECRTRFGAGGEFLFGHFTIADAMYAPVATRFVTYGTALDDVASAYVKTIMGLPAMKEWLEGAAAEEKRKAASPA